MRKYNEDPRQSITEGKHNSDVLNFIDDLHELLTKLKKTDKKAASKLFTLAGPLVKELHTFVTDDGDDGNDYAKQSGLFDIKFPL
jgi:hypothetical protein